MRVVTRALLVCMLGVFGLYLSSSSLRATPIVALSTARPTAVQVLRNVPYVQPADPARSGDLYLPATKDAGTRPAVVVVHGGAWLFGSKSSSGVVYDSQGLAAQGYVVFNINYRLVGAGGTFPGDEQDVKDAIAFLAAHAGRWRVDPQRIALLGSSAGAHLALLAAYTPNTGIFAPPHYAGSRAKIVAVVSFFGPTDLDKMRSVVVRDYLGGSFTRDVSLRVYRLASPVSYASHAVPTLFLHGTADHVVPFAQSVELERQLQRAGIPAELLAIPGADHAFDDAPGPARDTAFARALVFLDSLLGNRP